MEKTLVLIKPDGVSRGLVGEIIRRYEAHMLHISEMQLVQPTAEMLCAHYIEHVDKDFFCELVEYMSSGPVIALVLCGESAISLVRKINGSTNFMSAELGSIRGDFASSITQNLVHASDSQSGFEREYDIWFKSL
ncbi:nucleoside diphosphate kinase Ndk [Peptoclostridium acidaminophilum DSM 3953]|uniref:Nucleoside diphosphate kinase n=1 Tax=Peptoclostridium acidaminophilum DSM 3953 TaxID=1286171 RepID=W8U761_PEPAC|nr:nucleoside-diphosphate kinase [Peptoclostridium acidaminophilum]AHM56726.1 nucleoside diphosphate kinase Ndk [Peptoclostridium acidaminophilum DSM 3953]